MKYGAEIRDIEAARVAVAVRYLGGYMWLAKGEVKVELPEFEGKTELEPKIMADVNQHRDSLVAMLTDYRFDDIASAIRMNNPDSEFNPSSEMLDERLELHLREQTGCCDDDAGNYCPEAERLINWREEAGA